MASYEIVGSEPLRGEVHVSGSKNAALYAVAATLLTSEEVVLHNVPLIADIDELTDIMAELGTLVKKDGHSVSLKTDSIKSTVPTPESVRKLRASFLLVGAL